MPIANGFLRPDQFAEEYFFELKVGFCDTCKMVQLIEQPDREMMFHQHYAFFSSTSVRMADHFKRFALGVMDRLDPARDPFVVEIGSNDGIMLRHFAQKGIRHLGVEPSENVARVAREQGIQTLCRFFDGDLAQEITERHGPADAVIAANVMCHIPYLNSVAEGIRRVLKPDGLLIFEDPYLADIIAKTSYDQIYDEHAFYFSATSVRHLFEQHGIDLIDVQPQEVHGGSMRYVLAHAGAHRASERVGAQIQKETEMGLHRPETFARFRSHVERSRRDLLALLEKQRDARKRVVGYAATSKSTTVLNYCGITTDLIEYISDTTPIKHGAFSPGAHIPVLPHETFVNDYPDYALLFGWNHAGEIMAKEGAFAASGGKWIVYVPRVQVLE